MSIMSLDIGLKRVGVALNLTNQTITPIKAIIRKNRNQASSDVRALIKEWSIKKLVVGLPEDEGMRRGIKHFVSLIGFDNITYVDEDFSSQEASQLMQGITKDIRDGKSDSIASMLILQRFLDNRV